MVKDETVYLNQILSAIDKIESFFSGVNKKNFKSDHKTQSAIIMQLIIIGETVKRLSEKTKKLRSLPWKEISGFRDRAIHNYFDIDLDIVINTVKSDIPVLKRELLLLLRDLKS